MAGDIALGRETVLFIATETTVGSAIYPEAVDTVMLIDSGSFSQQITMLGNEEKRDSRTRQAPIPGRYPPGDFNFTTYLKPSGTAGTKPEDEVLWYCALGSLTTQAATTVSTDIAPAITGFSVATGAIATDIGILVSDEITFITSHKNNVSHSVIKVSPALSTAPAKSDAVTASLTYEPITSNPPTCTIWFKKGHTVFHQTGCVVNQPEVGIDPDNLGTVAWTGQFMKQIYTGTDALAAACTAAATTLNVTDEEKFMEGSVISVMSGGTAAEYVLVNSNPVTAGYIHVTRGYDPGTHTSVGAAHTNTGSVLQPWIPSIATTLGAPQVGYKGFVQVAGTNVTFRTPTVTFNNNAKLLEGEKNDQRYVTAFVTPNYRDVDVSMPAVFRKEILKYFSRARKGSAKEIFIPYGDPTDAGNVVAIQLRQATFETPALSGDEEVEADVAAKAHGAAGKDNDEYRIAFL